ncbi:DNA polymerase zeta [Metarhizium rileyi]|uniref:DNA polymerase n=1 Tax=Metarhizium rileyi (strain RCEF 4871) TaxID=1649241 RepID=A0A5C6GAY1_METRR|nr:DNA polymerase zeta [Metarhizium rileyi]
MNLFRVRLNCIDHYQATPTRYDPQLRNDVRASQAVRGPKVPVVRIFGSTETGQKVCAHIHGAFPYLYVEYDGDLAPDEVGAYIFRLHLSIDYALAVSYRRDQYGENANFVARITLVKGIPFYGFHVGYRFFLKIYMFNPIVMTRLADLLQQGVIMKRKFQPYEAHLQYLLQFMVDYNLYGCDYLDSSKTGFRSPVPEYDDGSSSSHLWHSQSVRPHNITDDPSLPRLSHCSIEVDICVQHITNRKTVKERQLHHNLDERKFPMPEDLKLVCSMAGLWRDETKRRRRQMPRGKQGQSPFPPEVLVSMSADARQSQMQSWIHEQEYSMNMTKLVNADLAEYEDKNPRFEDFVEQADPDEEVHTALQSVEDLFPNKLMPALGLLSNVSQSTGNPPASSIEVDEKTILQEPMPADDFFPDDSDEEGLRDLNQIEEVGQDVAGAVTEHPLANSESLTMRSLQPSSHLMPGLCLSVLATGMLPVVPVSQELLDAAEDEGLVGRAPKFNALRTQQLMTRKRLGSVVSPTCSPEKRLRSHKAISSSYVQQAGVDHASIHELNEFNSPAHRLATLSSPKGRASKSSIAPSTASNSTLNYGLPKNRDGENSKMGFSQHSQVSPIQQSDGGKMSKPVPRGQSVDDQFRAMASSDCTSSAPIFFSSLSEHDDEATRIQQAIAKVVDNRFLIYSHMPPTASQCPVVKDSRLPDVIYQDAFYSKESDVPERNREYAGREYRLESNTLPFLPDFDINGSSYTSYGIKPDNYQVRQVLEQEQALQRRHCTWRNWEYAQVPPSHQEVVLWLEAKRQLKEAGKKDSKRINPSPRAWLSQIDGPTQKNKHGFKYTQKGKSTSVEHEVQYMSTMSLEVHVNTRGKYVPNPEEDEVQCIFWACKSDEVVAVSQASPDEVHTGMVVLSTDGKANQAMHASTRSDIFVESSELDVIVRMVEIVRAYDPDILTGYEVHGSSWGFLIERARCKYDYNLCDEFSRMKSDSHGRFGKQNDRWGFNTTSTIRVTGRHMINIWRAMRGELNLLQYTLENVAWHLLHRRVPHYSWRTLTDWYKSGKSGDVGKIVKYYQMRTMMDIQILETNELISRTSEQARLLGVDFFSVFSRGSQFKVESIMFRIAKPENFMLVSPSRKQVGSQNALECLPLVMEPQSAFYNSPLLVLDFQSLYPSVMIAYNYCYSTFLGRITNWRGVNKMGFTEYKRQQGLLALLKDYINIAPNGMMYVKTEIRKSLLAKMLTEILETRVMIKSGMKNDKDDKVLQQLLNNRQLALKLLANVTYGYTSASFSGRMPCSEIADSIVQTGRETLERATAYIHSVERWGAEVVYGDTDSLFVYLKGRTRDQAFDIGNEMAEAITKINPQPIKLKFEKVYHPCVLLAKKRYVGYKYESKDQATPEFDAKGIETVRRDGTPAEQKIEEKALKMLFETADLSQIKEYFQKQCDKILRGAVSVQDFCFAKEVRLGTYSDKGPPPPGALISTKKMLQDARAEPQYGERVPYVVITGAPGARLIDRSVAPEDLLANPHWQLDAEYYISKNLIPPLERIFNLVGANVRQWYDEMPKVQRIHRAPNEPGLKKTTLESYMRSTHCLVCNAKFAEEGQTLCPACRGNTPASLFMLQTRLSAEERSYRDILSICRTCSGLSPLEDVRCDSKDCPVFWTRTKQRTKVTGMTATAGPVIRALAEGNMKRSALDW